MIIPYQWITFCDQNPVGPHVRWDSYWLERILDGSEWRVPSGCRFEHRDIQPGEGGILIFPAGHYGDHGENGAALARLQNTVDAMPWYLLIATSDEGSSFPWARFRLSPDARLWVQTPRPTKAYPKETRFFGFGSPTPAKNFPVVQRDLDVVFSGQINHARREDMRRAVTEWAQTHPTMTLMNGTEGFADGFEGEHYNKLMARARIAPAPSGPLTQDSFRCYEALEAGAVPIQDAVRPDGRGLGYWDMLGLALFQIGDWSDFTAAVDYLGLPESRVQIQSKWQQYKREIVYRLHEDMRAASGSVPADPQGPDDLITVVVPTSPTPHHPDPWMIQRCIETVRERLPRAEILITCDGVREEQMHRLDGYRGYLEALVDWTRTQDNIVPFVYPQHLHESGMLKRMIHEVRTPYMLYMESDTTLEGEIDLSRVLDEMWQHDLNGMRFYHEKKVPNSHRYLFLETYPREGAPFLRTVQFSTRPSVWNMTWVREMVDTYVGPNSRAMFEDSIYGVVQHGWRAPYKSYAQREEVWHNHRLAVWAPDRNLEHSGHLDGRGEDPKYRMWIEHPTEDIPPGAPSPGWHQGSE